MPQPNVPGVDPQLQAQCDAFRHDYRAVQAEIAKAIVGHNEIIDGVLTCLFSCACAALTSAWADWTCAAA